MFYQNVLERDIQTVMDCFMNNSLEANPINFHSTLFIKIDAEDLNIIIGIDTLKLTYDMTFWTV